MAKGFYRSYFHIGKLGFKVAKLNFKNGNPFIGFFIACIQNVLERKRYRYYCLGKMHRQWGKKWKHDGITPMFCPTYFTCGLFNVVKHLPKTVSYTEMAKMAKTYTKGNKKYKGLRDYQLVDAFFNVFTLYLIQSDIKEDNFRRDENGILYCIDYGDFYCGNLSNCCGALIDYK